MIYPDVSVKEWHKKYPELDIIKKKCTHCNKILKPRPFISKHWAGFEGAPCPCGKNKSNWSSSITRTQEEHEKWAALFGEFEK